MRAMRDREGNQAMRHLRLIAALVGFLPVFAASIAGANPVGRIPDNAMLTIGHRGASGYAPEYTFPAYDLALRMGADYIEQDLQFSSRHTSQTAMTRARSLAST